MTPRLAAAALALAALFTPGDDDEELTLAELDLDVSSLAEKREQVFEYRIGSQSLGTVTMTTSGTDDGAIRLHDVYDIEFGGESLAFDLTMICDATPTLRPRSVRCVAGGESDEVASYDAERDGDDLVVRFDGRDPRTVTLPDDATSYEALFRLVTLLPFDDGLRVAVPPRFEGGEGKLHHTMGEPALVYRGTEWYAADGETLETLHRFDLEGGFGVSSSYWVNADRELRRALIDGRKEMRVVPPDDEK